MYRASLRQRLWRSLCHRSASLREARRQSGGSGLLRPGEIRVPPVTPLRSKAHKSRTAENPSTDERALLPSQIPADVPGAISEWARMPSPGREYIRNTCIAEARRDSPWPARASRPESLSSPKRTAKFHCEARSAAASSPRDRAPAEGGQLARRRSRRRTCRAASEHTRPHTLHKDEQ